MPHWTPRPKGAYLSPRNHERTWPLPNFKISFKVQADDTPYENLSYGIAIRAHSIGDVFSQISKVVDALPRAESEPHAEPK